MARKWRVDVTYRLKPGARGEFLKGLRELGIAEASRREPGNRRYLYILPDGEADTLLLSELWDTQAQQRAHLESPHCRQLAELKKRYVAETELRTAEVEREPQRFYIASCVFTVRFPELSRRLQAYVADRFRIPIVRCCVPRYSLQYFQEQLPDSHRPAWGGLPDSADFAAGDTVYSLCHNCSAILEESMPGVQARSLWELLLTDGDFPFPDYRGRAVFVQDCWRARDRAAEQDAVRALLRRMGLDVREAPQAREATDFCGVSLYRPAPQRNLDMAPERFVKRAAGKFLPHSAEEQAALMRAYCAPFAGGSVAAYCHYCLEGLALGGANAFHLASLLFEPEACAPGLGLAE